MMVHRWEPTSAIVIAGGQSRRFGQDKRRLRLWGADGPTLLAHTVSVVAGLCADVVVVLNDPEVWRDLPARLVGDRYADGGALGGLYTGLAAAQCAYALAIACDMPFLSCDLLCAMLERTRDYDVLVPRTFRAGVARNGLDVEPLHAIYHRACLGPMQAALEGGQRQIVSFFPALRVEYVEAAEIQRYDANGFSFLNINTPDQLSEVQRLLGDR